MGCFGSTTVSTPSTRPLAIVHSPCKWSKSLGTVFSGLSPADSNIRVTNNAVLEVMGGSNSRDRTRRTAPFAGRADLLAINSGAGCGSVGGKGNWRGRQRADRVGRAARQRTLARVALGGLQRLHLHQR